VPSNRTRLAAFAFGCQPIEFVEDFLHDWRSLLRQPAQRPLSFKAPPNSFVFIEAIDEFVNVGTRSHVFF
jgi:hypothetical protein